MASLTRYGLRGYRYKSRNHIFAGSPVAPADTPPSFVADYETVFSNSTTPKTTGTFNGLTGDILVALVGDSNDDGTENFTFSSTPSETWIELTETTGSTGADAWAQPATTVLTADRTGMTVTATRTAPASSSNFFGLTVAHFSGSDGIGASAASTGAGGQPALNITTQHNNSAIVYMVIDWTPVDGATRTHRTVNGYTPTAGNGQELSYYFNSGQYTVYVAYIPDAGPAGLQTVGLTAPASQDSQVVAVEVRGNASGASAVSLPDTGSGADALTISATASLADTATAADALAITVAAPLADTATGADAFSASATVGLADTAAGADALQVTPQLLSNLRLWFRAADLSGLADGTAVSSWTSITGTSVASQGTGANQPTKQTASGETVVRFDKTNDRLTLNGDGLTVTQNVTGVTVFARVKPSDVTGTNVILAFNNGATAGSHRLILRELTNWDAGGRRLDADTFAQISGGTAASTTSIAVLSLVADYTNTDLFLYLDGVAAGQNTSWLTTGSTSNTASLSAAIGSTTDSTPVEFWGGDVYEILVYDRVLDAAERQQVEAFLGATGTAARTLTETATATDSLAVQNVVAADPYQASYQVPGFFLWPEVASVQLWGDQTAPAGPIGVSLTEAATAADALAITVATALADTATGSDSLSVAVAVPLADTATGVDALSISGSANPSLPDTATGADALTITATSPLAETAAGADALAISSPVSLSDTATGVDAVGSPTATVPLAHTGTGADVRTSTATTLLSEGGTAADTMSVSGSANPALPETATASDQLSIAVTLTLADTMAGVDALTAVRLVSLSDTATGADALAAVRLLSLAEAATGADSLAIAAAQPLAETAAGADALAVSVALTAADAASAVDLLSILPILLYEGTITGGVLAGASVRGSAGSGSGLTGQRQSE
jgi:hypothetical protein